VKNPHFYKRASFSLSVSAWFGFQLDSDGVRNKERSGKVAGIAILQTPEVSLSQWIARRSLESIH
jgi:hypothetical protein